MYACICHAVTEAEIDKAVDAGATSLTDVNGMTGAGGTCGTCHDHVEDLIEARCGACPLVALAVA